LSTNAMNHKAHQLILHFGLPKTGTSAIQRALFNQRRELLKNHNTLYPGQYENHFFFQGLFSKQPESLIQIQMLGLQNRDGITDFLESYRNDILAEINKLQPRQIIISSEYFISMSVEELRAMREFLRSFAENIVLFAYVRDPWSWSLSLAQEHIRTGWWKSEVKVTYRDSLTEIFNKFETAFETVCMAAPYIQGSDIVKDFCGRFGLLDLDFGNQKYINAGMQKEAACVMLLLNELYPVFDQNNNLITDPARDWMAEAIQSSPLSITPLRLSRNTAREIYEKSRADVEMVEKRYFGGKRFLSDQYNILKTSEFDDTLSISNFTVEQLSEYLLSCMHVLAERAVEGYWTYEELIEIKNSKTWKIILVFRRLRVTLAPIDSHRDRILRRLTDGFFALVRLLRRKQT
ncbi:MAG TPA: hypothetical protein VK909_14925, partial [Anaerolineales bacterium]|nr:hypothetical protein [Anaerolineales bacterium]